MTPDDADLSFPVALTAIQPFPFNDFARICTQLAGETRKLEKIRLLAEYLRTLEGDALALVTTWFAGRPLPGSQTKALHVGGAVLSSALAMAAGVGQSRLQEVYLKHSDLGEAAAELLANRSAVSSLTLADVRELFQALQIARGGLTKTPLLREFLSRCSPVEAKYVVKIITGDLRIGLKEGLVEEALAAAFAQSASTVRQAHLLVGDIGETATLAAAGTLELAQLHPFRPVKVMLASPEPSAAEVWSRTGAENKVLWLEDKYDGIRCQLHKVGRRVALYSRDLKEITLTFLDIADSAQRLAADVVSDGELVAMRGEDVRPFAELQKRLGRREPDLFLHDEVPIRYVMFDLLWLNGQTLLGQPLATRRAELEKLTPLPACLGLARTSQANSASEIDAAFEAARSRGNEGLMIKDPQSLYTPGRRGLAWLKLKKALATLDCVVVGVEYGHGKRNQVLSDYTFAVRDETTGELKTIGKAYTGLTDKEIAELTQHFLKVAVRQHGRYFEVPPEVVIEIAFDRLQPSSRHDSGLAMRFPRIVRVRTDKTPAEIDTLQTAQKLAIR